LASQVLRDDEVAVLKTLICSKCLFPDATPLGVLKAMASVMAASEGCLVICAIRGALSAAVTTPDVLKMEASVMAANQVCLVINATCGALSAASPSPDALKTEGNVTNAGPGIMAICAAISVETDAAAASVNVKVDTATVTAFLTGLETSVSVCIFIRHPLNTDYT
jgi:hypothetical protein